MSIRKPWPAASTGSTHHRAGSRRFTRQFTLPTLSFKKHIEEDGAEEFNSLPDSVSEIIVSPVTLLEVHSAVARRLKERTLKAADAQWIEKEFMTDYNFFGAVDWNDDLIGESLRIIIECLTAYSFQENTGIGTDSPYPHASENDREAIEMKNT